MNPFDIMIQNLMALGFYGFVLPWIFVFTVFYALLLKSKILGEDQKIIGVVALVAAFLVTAFFAPLGMVIANLFGTATLFLAGILVVILLVSMAGFKIEDLAGNKIIMYLVALIGVIIFVAVALSSVIQVSVNESVIAAVLMVIVMIAAVYFIAGKSG